jgi:hypothetical protein
MQWHGSVEERKEKWKDYFYNLLGQPLKVPDDHFEVTLFLFNPTSPGVILELTVPAGGHYGPPSVTFEWDIQ